MKIKYLAFAVGILACISSTASAEDYGYNAPKSNYSPQQLHVYENDEQYNMPTQYKGKYYPNDEPVISYRGSSQSTQNQAAPKGAQAYPYYYY